MRKKTGETLIETLLTIMVILVALLSSFKIVSLAFLQKNLTADRIIATNLAREGIEAVRYIRDYNWLYYGSDQRICWNHLQDNNDADDGDTQNANGAPDGILDSKDAECTESGPNGFAVNQISAENPGVNSGKMEYILKQKGSHWYITRAGTNGYLTQNGDANTLTKNNLGINADGTEGANSTDIVQSFRLCKDSQNELYVSCLNNQNPKADTTKRSPFIRFVRIEYTGDPKDTTLDGTITNGQEQNIIKVSVGVKWVEQGIMQDVDLVTYLSDFYQRIPNDTKN